MTEHFNGLTPAEAERLAMLAEEAGEIVQIVGKILRHGYGSYHPDNPPPAGQTNREMLQREITDLIAVSIAMSDQRDISDRCGDLRLCEPAWKKKLQYTHYQ